MEAGPRLIASFDRLQKPGIEPVTSGLQRGELYITTAPRRLLSSFLSDVILLYASIHVGTAVIRSEGVRIV